MPQRHPHDAPAGATGVLVLADGTIVWGHGFGAVGSGVGEVCFNTAMTGYQEVLTDPSYAGQIITFTFPHIGNVGTNADDVERDASAAIGCITREIPTAPSNFRSEMTLPDWMAAKGLIGLAGIDTRALTRRIREGGAPNAVVAHAPDGVFDIAALLAQAQGWPGLVGMDLAKTVSRGDTGTWDAGVWALGSGYEIPFASSEVETPIRSAPPRGISTSLDASGFRELVKAWAPRPVARYSPPRPWPLHCPVQWQSPTPSFCARRRHCRTAPL